jgi:hypothetical protein
MMMLSNIVMYMNGVEKPGGGKNFTKWKADLMLIVAIMDQDHSFHEDKSVEPKGDNETSPWHIARLNMRK